MSNSVNHKFEHYLSIVVIFERFLKVFEELCFLLHVDLKVGYLVFGVEDSVDEVFTLHEVDVHGVFDDFSGV